MRETLVEMVLEYIMILQTSPHSPTPCEEPFPQDHGEHGQRDMGQSDSQPGPDTGRKSPRMFHPSVWPQLASAPPAWPRVRPTELTHSRGSQRPTLTEVTRCTCGLPD